MSWLKDETERAADMAAALRLGSQAFEKAVNDGNCVIVAVPATPEGIARGVKYLQDMANNLWPQHQNDV